MRTKEFFILVGLVSVMLAPAAMAWGPTGHRIVGAAAHAMLDPKARAEVDGILAFGKQESTLEALDRACNWPDKIRDKAGWEWSSPLHYVNIPRSTRHYLAERDCPEGRCVTAAITRYANELLQPQLSAERRWQALAFLCHFVGDLHQPLHAGFRDDRGANQVKIEYLGQEWNLHRFWDSVVVGEHIDNEADMISHIVSSGPLNSSSNWNPDEVIQWTGESHALAMDAAYPEGTVISEDFARQTWQITQSQWLKASLRLARILNAVLGEPDVTLVD